ncbi:ECF transporter S component [Lentibacillus sp.]|uniref:ECF transporter S component n=1 Tax=Lentibacillus sp. TaxID=1925746 RepID=UPI0039C8E37D
MGEDLILQKNIQSTSLLKLIILALLGTISLVLFFLNFPLPFLPPYLKIDFSEVPALIAALIFSPIAGVVVEGIKNLLYLIVSGAGDPIGVASNFLAGVMFVVPVAFLYHRYKGTKSVISGLVSGTIIMAFGMSVLNYFVILPAYAWFIGAPEMAGATAKWVAVMAGILPFNLIKGVVIGALFVPLFIKMKTWIEQKQTNLAA